MSHKGSRSKSGCKTCTARKVRCDEREGICLNCERLGLPCTGAVQGASQQSQGTGPNNLSETIGLKRKRTFRSCGSCRATKTRCSGERPVCLRCRGKSLQCNYEDASQPAWKQQLRFAMTQRSFLDGDYTPDSGSNFELLDQDDLAGSANSGSRAVNFQHDNNAQWLRSRTLPRSREVNTLVEHYFTNIHPLRCFGFLHKPSFMLRLDLVDTSKREDDALLLIVCALGSLFYVVENSPASDGSLLAGSQWAKRAQQLILAQLGNISVENLMAALLLHEYELRLGNFGNAFMLSGLTARMAQALQINLEHSTDIVCQNIGGGPDASTKESRRRLMWCCWITDTLIGSGVDQLILIKDSDIKIQLPCTEKNFLLQTPCITEVLEPGQFLKFLTPDSLPAYPQDNMGIRACYLRYIKTRRKVLK